MSIQEFQDMIEKHFFDELYRQLQRESRQPFPIHDPTQGELTGYTLQVISFLVVNSPQNSILEESFLQNRSDKLFITSQMY